MDSIKTSKTFDLINLIIKNFKFLSNFIFRNVEINIQTKLDYFFMAKRSFIFLIYTLVKSGVLIMLGRKEKMYELLEFNMYLK